MPRVTFSGSCIGGRRVGERRVGTSVAVSVGGTDVADGASVGSLVRAGESVGELLGVVGKTAARVSVIVAIISSVNVADGIARVMLGGIPVATAVAVRVGTAAGCVGVGCAARAPGPHAAMSITTTNHAAGLKKRERTSGYFTRVLAD